MRSTSHYGDGAAPPADLPTKTRDQVHAEYTRRQDRFRAEGERLSRRDAALGNARLAVFVLGLLMLWVALRHELFSAWWSLAPFIGFIVLAIIHDRALRQRERTERAAAFYESCLLRVDDRWIGSGNAGTRFADPDHPAALDLDLFGRGSLFERLCLARTRIGEDTLATWLGEPAPAVTVLARQQAVAELLPRLDLREEMVLLGEEAQSGVDSDPLARWGAEPAEHFSRGLRLLAFMFSLANVAGLVAWLAGHGWLPLLATLVGGQVFEAVLRSRVQRVVGGVDRPAHDLALLGLLLARIERERFETPMLQELRAGLDIAGHPPSERIARLESRVGYLHARKNALFAPFGALLLWTTQFAFAIENWRVDNGPHLEDWLRAIGEFDALCSLAGYAYERPDDVFPEVMEGEPRFEAEDMGHPLLPVARLVRNNLRLDGSARLYIVSGSNMSGKSTLLRAVGVNAVLALAGAPVCASSLRLSVIRIGASIRTLDSLQAGVSRFYAEITRLRQIVGLAEEGPLLFLLDEILHGTNSHDRRIGAEAVIRALLKRGAMGMVTTHDLALARVTDDPDLQAMNVHFEDQMEDGKMTFDYRLRPGVVTRSNAIALMRAIGLEV